jgi:hypothetical protein
MFVNVKATEKDSWLFLWEAIEMTSENGCDLLEKK